MTYSHENFSGGSSLNDEVDAKFYQDAYDVPPQSGPSASPENTPSVRDSGQTAAQDGGFFAFAAPMWQGITEDFTEHPLNLVEAAGIGAAAAAVGVVAFSAAPLLATIATAGAIVFGAKAAIDGAVDWEHQASVLAHPEQHTQEEIDKATESMKGYGAKSLETIVGGAAMPFGGWAGSLLREPIMDMGAVAGSAVLSWAGKTFPSVAEGVASVASPIVSGIETAASSLFSGIGSLFGGKVGSVAMTASQTVADAAAAASKKATDFASKLTDGDGNWTLASTAKEKLSPLMKQVRTAGGVVFEQAGNLVDKTQSMAASIADSPFAQKVSEKLTPGLEKVVEKTTPVRAKAAEILSPVVDRSGQLASEYSQNAGQLASDMTDRVAQLYKAGKDGLVSAYAEQSPKVFELAQRYIKDPKQLISAGTGLTYAYLPVEDPALISASMAAASPLVPGPIHASA